jgi:hypothetical protein
MPGVHDLLVKIQSLPAERIAQIEDFVDFLSAKTRRLAAMGRLLAVAPALESVGMPPMTEGEIQAEVDAVRAAGASSEPAFASIWGNSEDDAYDAL